MTDFKMRQDGPCWEFELCEDEVGLVLKSFGGFGGWGFTKEEEIKLAKHLYNKHLKDIKPISSRVREALKDYDPLEADNE